MRYSNIHTHTVFSDGKNTPEEMILRALELGFSSIGISDHSETAFDSDYCMGGREYADYRRHLSELKERYGDRIEVFCGIEQDSFSPGSCEDFDYVIGSVHYVFAEGKHLPVDSSLAIQLESIANHCGGDRLEYARRYYHEVAENAVKGGYQVQGHIDLLNKFNLFDEPCDQYRRLALEALDTVLDHIPYIEMNTGAIARGYTALYPDTFLLERILEKGGKLILNGDSHSAEKLDCYFDQSVALLKRIGFTTLYQLRKSGWEVVSIS